MVLGNVSFHEENAMVRIVLLITVALSGNIWTYFRGLEEVKFTAALGAQCDLAGILDPDGCPRPGATTDSGGLADPDG